MMGSKKGKGIKVRLEIKIPEAILRSLKHVMETCLRKH